RKRSARARAGPWRWAGADDVSGCAGSAPSHRRSRYFVIGFDCHTIEIAAFGETVVESFDGVDPIGNRLEAAAVAVRFQCIGRRRGCGDLLDEHIAFFLTEACLAPPRRTGRTPICTERDDLTLVLKLSTCSRVAEDDLAGHGSLRCEILVKVSM